MTHSKKIRFAVGLILMIVIALSAGLFMTWNGASEELSQSGIWLPGLAAMSVLMTLLLGFYILKVFTTSRQAMQDTLKKLANGDIEMSAINEHDTEISELSESVDLIRRQLLESKHRLQQKAELSLQL